MLAKIRSGASVKNSMLPKIEEKSYATKNPTRGGGGGALVFPLPLQA